MPDLRGLFLRGHGGNSAALGEIQGDIIRNITGTMGDVHFGTSPWNNNAFRASISGNNGQGTGSWNNNYGDLVFDASLVVPTGPENRPINVAVRFLIRARP